MPLLSAPGVTLAGPRGVYRAHVGRELSDDGLYKESNSRLREQLLISEFLRAVVQQYAVYYQIEQLRKLRKGWDSDGADPPNDTAFATINRVLEEARNQRIDVSRIVPSAEGGIGACFVSGNRYAHIEASNEGELTMVNFCGGGPAEVNEIRDEQSLQKALSRIREYIDV